MIDRHIENVSNINWLSIKSDNGMKRWYIVPGVICNTAQASSLSLRVFIGRIICKHSTILSRYLHVDSSISWPSLKITCHLEDNELICSYRGEKISIKIWDIPSTVVWNIILCIYFIYLFIPFFKIWSRISMKLYFRVRCVSIFQEARISWCKSSLKSICR